MRSRMIGRDERDASFARATKAPTAGVRDGVIVDASYWRGVDDARERELGVAQWIVCAEDLRSGADGQEYLREIERSGRKVWTTDPRAAAGRMSFASESEAGVFVAGTFTEREINQFGIHPTAFYPLAKGGR